jgi:hypothetical protein
MIAWLVLKSVTRTSFSRAVDNPLKSPFTHLQVSFRTDQLPYAVETFFSIFMVQAGLDCPGVGCLSRSLFSFIGREMFTLEDVSKFFRARTKLHVLTSLRLGMESQIPFDQMMEMR